MTRLAICPFVCVLAAGLLTAGAAAANPARQPAQTDLKHMSLEELGDIVVTSVAKQPEDVWKTPAAIVVLTREDIVRSGATSIADVLRLVPGIEVARVDSGRNWVVGVRGFGDQYSKSLLVLIDGRSVYTPLFAGTQWSLQDLLLDDIDRIEIIRGPGGTVWGANAVNGVINIITRSAADTKGAMGTLAAGNVDEIIGGARYGAAIGDTGAFRVYGKGFRRGSEWHRDGRNFDRWHLSQGGARADWTRGDRDTFSVHGDGYTGELGESLLVSTYAPPASGLVDTPSSFSGANVVGRWDRRLDGGASFTLQSYWDYTKRLGTNFGETRNSFDVDFVHRLGVRGRNSVIWGAGLRLQPARYVQTIESADFEPHDRGYNLFSAFAQDAVKVGAAFTVTGGVKLERNSYTGLETQPSASLLWAPTAHQSAWLAVTRAVRTPSRIDTDIRVEQYAFTQGLPVYVSVAGTPTVNAEDLFSTEAGYRTLLGRSLYLDLAVFHHRYTGLISLGAPGVDFPTRDGTTYERLTFPFVNALDGPTRGFEIAPNASVNAHLQLKGSYSYLSVDLTPRAGIPKTSFTSMLQSDAPAHLVVAQATITAGSFDVTPTYRFVSARQATKIPGYSELDLPLQWHPGPHLAISLVGQNLLHAHHAEWARDPGPNVEIRRSVYARVTLFTMR